MRSTDVDDTETYRRSNSEVMRRFDVMEESLTKIREAMARREGIEVGMVNDLAKLSDIPRVCADLDARLKALEGSGGNLDRWIGADGYMRSKAFGGVVLALLLAAGVLGWSDVAASMPRLSFPTVFQEQSQGLELPGPPVPKPIL